MGDLRKKERLGNQKSLRKKLTGEDSTGIHRRTQRVQHRPQGGENEEKTEKKFKQIVGLKQNKFWGKGSGWKETGSQGEVQGDKGDRELPGK